MRWWFVDFPVGNCGLGSRRPHRGSVGCESDWRYWIVAASDWSVDAVVRVCLPRAGLEVHAAVRGRAERGQWVGRRGCGGSIEGIEE